MCPSAAGKALVGCSYLETEVITDSGSGDMLICLLGLTFCWRPASYLYQNLKSFIFSWMSSNQHVPSRVKTRLPVFLLSLLWIPLSTIALHNLHPTTPPSLHPSISLPCDAFTPPSHHPSMHPSAPLHHSIPACSVTWAAAPAGASPGLPSKPALCRLQILSASRL